jgi:hypothetical protein
LRAGAAGAGLAIGLVIVVLLAMNLVASRAQERAGAPTSGASGASTAADQATQPTQATAAIARDERDEIPPPPPAEGPTPCAITAQPVTATMSAPRPVAAETRAPATNGARATAARDYGF